MPELPLRDQVVILADNFEHSFPLEIIAWAAHTFGDGLTMATGFGPEGVVLMHVLAQTALHVPVFYVDTDLLFEETHQLRDQLAARLGINFVRLSTELTLADQADQYGPELWAREPNKCCGLRKIAPLRNYLKDKQAWITGIRRDQTHFRANAKAIEWDESYGLVKINPLVTWTSDQVWTYIQLYELPTNILHTKGYPSIGCKTCTRPAAERGDPRSGRWVGFDKVECGIHVQNS
jgi:phosphoadenosine phosphosulfate reductase